MEMANQCCLLQELLLNLEARREMLMESNSPSEIREILEAIFFDVGAINASDSAPSLYQSATYVLYCIHNVLKGDLLRRDLNRVLLSFINLLEDCL